MSFHSTRNNTAGLAPYPYEDTRVQGSAQARHMPAMIAQDDLSNQPGQFMRTHLSCVE